MTAQTEPFLRPWRAGDAESVLEAFRAPDMAHQGPPMLDPSAATRWIADHRWAASPSEFSFAIDIAGIAVGNVAVRDLESRHQTGWVSYWVAESARGRGLASRAVATVCAWLFLQGETFRLELGHRANNPASGAVAARAGFSVEGLQRQKLRYGTERFDVVACSRLATDPPPAVELLRIVDLP
ncbi:GNAT family N-acetyltransferase [Arthrobacter russicus]|jgi:ribosomal-protein-alanine N-acetyltransferase|uniref:RimJ/RimL family protein N-acetyltransferase n=1 Tax=Arthrobacter russicus TaxID=172040 RepID=A0ABU1JDJ9_9MICC|nr:GNAT family protein [Arthrobacter russicus]MDR6270220.1 RimJ/RimL family protein N-acetyltransferase [Arthrobacter russicus]